MSENEVSLKLPPFWAAEPQIWFAQTEAQFALRKIVADDTKYFYVLSALDQATASRLKDFISNPPEEDKYEALKDRLVETFDLSEPERASLLLHFRPLGDAKPSTLMDEMLALLGDHPPCFLFRQLFLERLPEDMRAQLIDAGIDDCRQLARRADRIWAARQGTNYANNVQTAPALAPECMSPGASDIGHEGCITDAVQRRPRAPPKPKKRQPPTAPGLCYYHRTYGARARRCQQPCGWQGNELAGRQ